ncbi:signal recognition particle receptor beta subunit-domain-containing protein [Halteromyces radiatus]|uniref:signal recognition particle receptor beta subunit-domain-containing protein n=1 Tax=Halteromyces radiatus TaxID=101107 RepID=UPI00221F4861|nr:signal recognition particle receptor beta subunit-domain-containing protein [Halteromyces radiatus]KAI8096152.1 signal recognition particle receptor beta subunit-domain-containing protein [Halteromyces radiatus]
MFTFDQPIVLTGLVLFFIAILIFAALSLVKKQQNKNTVLILGISDVGKSALFFLLTFGRVTSTITTMTENEGTLVLDNKKINLVDIPGHERVRHRYTDFVPVTKRIVFMVDSTTIVRQIRPTAEYLYQVLAQPTVQAQATPILILCNKYDMITAYPLLKIKPLLEAEINRLRSTRTAAVEQQQGDEQEAFLGYEGEPFKFEHLDNPVDFEQCTVLQKDVDRVTDWILQN